jgi:RHS repeat-associated protein
MRRLAVPLLLVLSLCVPAAAGAAHVAARHHARHAHVQRRPHPLRGWHARKPRVRVRAHAIEHRHRPLRHFARPTARQRRLAGLLGGPRAPLAHAAAATAPAYTSGNVVGWGEDNDNELGDRAGATPPSGVRQPLENPIPVPSSIVQIVGGGGGSGYFVAVAPDGSAWAWGTSTMGGTGLGYNNGYATQGIGRIPISGVISVASGSNHTLFLTTHGLYGTGDNDSGDVVPDSCCGWYSSPVPIPITGVVAVAAGDDTSYVLRSDGTVWAFGSNGFGQLGQGDEGSRSGAVQLPGLTNIVAISGGLFGGYALKADGTVWSWGTNYQGTLGNGTFNEDAPSKPAQVVGLTNVVALSSGPDAIDEFATKADGTVWAWGENSAGTLGDGTTTSTATPKQITALTGVTAISSSRESGEALKADGTVLAWGQNRSGELGDGTYAAHFKPAPVFGVVHAAAIAVSEYTQAAAANIPDPAALPSGFGVGDENPAGLGLPGLHPGLVKTFDDLNVPGRGVTLDFSRSYDSDAAQGDGPLGHGWSYGYGMTVALDGAGNAVVTQENGSQATFTPGGGGFTPPKFVNAALTHNADGTWTFVRAQRLTFGFDAAGRLTSEKDLNGYVTRIAYPDANTQTITDPAGRAFVVSLSGGHIASVTSGARSVAFAYDGNGDLMAATDVGGGVTRFGYDADHRMVSVRRPRFAGDASTPPETIVYDAAGRMASVTDELGETTSYDYTSIPNAEKVTDPAGNVTVNRYVNGQLMSSTDGYGTSYAATAHYFYNPDSDAQTGVCDPQGRCQTVARDARGNVLAQTDGLGRTTSYSYDALNDQLTVTDPKGVTTTTTYDAAGNKLSQSRPLAGTTSVQTTTYTYGGAYPGDVMAMVDPNGRTWKFTYDAYGDMISKTAPPTAENSAGDKTTFSYDTAIGRRLTETSPRGNLSGATPAKYTTSFSYDAFGRQTQVRDPLWTSSDPLRHQTTDHYDANGNRDHTIDGNGQKTTFAYDAADRLTVTTRPDGTTTRVDHNPDGTTRSYTDARGKVTTYAYDPLGHVIAETDPDGRTTATTYDPAGNLVQQVSPGGSCDSGTLAGCETLTYDAANQLVSTRWADGRTTGLSNAVYDDDGERVSATDASGTTTWTYDGLNRLTSVKDGNGTTVSFGYDLAGNETSITYPGGKNKVTRDYDAAGRIDWIQDFKSNKTTFAYDADSNLVKTTEPTTAGVTDTAVFDATQHVTSIAVVKGTTNLATFAYTRNGADDVASGTTTGISEPAQSYAYDALRRLTASGSSSAPTQYAYDADGDITTRGASTLAYDDADQLCWQAPSVGGGASCAAPPATATTFAYDADGNRTSATPPTGTARTYAYDEADRLVSYNGTTSYVYDAAGLRMSRTPAGQAKQKFTWDRSLAIPLLLADASNSYVYGADGRPLEQIGSSGTVTFLHHDEIGSTRLLTSGTGANVGSYTYDPYGAVTAHTGSVTTPLQYTGEYTDSESGLVYLRARYYDPATAQFINVDPALEQTRDAYGYADDNPLTNTDPTGQFDIIKKNLTVEQARDWAFALHAIATGLDFELPPFIPATLVVDIVKAVGQAAAETMSIALDAAADTAEHIQVLENQRKTQQRKIYGVWFHIRIRITGPRVAIHPKVIRKEPRYTKKPKHRH